MLLLPLPSSLPCGLDLFKVSSSMPSPHRHMTTDLPFPTPLVTLSHSTPLVPFKIVIIFVLKFVLLVQ